MTVVNLADQPMEVSIAFVDSDTGKATPITTQTLAPFDFDGESVPPATFDIQFKLSGGATPLATCRVKVGDAETYRFAALNDAVAVQKDGYQPAKGADLFVATSPLCLART